MPYEISSIEDSSIIAVKHTGAVTTDELDALADEVRRYINEAGLKGVLIDARDLQSAPNRAEYLVMLRNRTDNPYLEVRVAFLFGEIAADTAEFAALATQNRGGTAWEFTDEGQAIRWLHDAAGSAR